MKRILKLDYRTISRYLPLLVNKPHLGVQSMARVTYFWLESASSSNAKVALCSALSLESESIVSDNIGNIG